ncbi:ABC-type glycerol-3-phosphate transport system substrate-binding protein [Paenibacillus sp. BK720]|nr:ABC-type glycerol-3-phosphate transport system substrate-binding protein [Paenibacillus sp. BK720]
MRNKRAVIACILILAVASLIFTRFKGESDPTSMHTGQDARQLSNIPSSPAANDPGPFYLNVYKDWVAKGLKPATETVSLQGANLSGESDKDLSIAGEYEGESGVLIWKSGQDNWIEYEVTIPSDGLYELNVSYHSYSNSAASSTTASRRPAVLSLQIDGVIPFREARSLTFWRKFQDEMPMKTNDYGDDIRPRSNEKNEWLNETLTDSSGGYDEPFQWHFTKGKHTLRFSGADPIVIGELKLHPPRSIPDYASVASRYPETKKISSSATQIVQAEDAVWKNDPAIQLSVDQDPLTKPKAKGYQTLNTLGGIRWQNGGQTAAWTFQVPESGLYRIAMRSYQGFNSNLSVFRTIAIDGKVPFRELLSYRFPYFSKWKGTVLTGSAGENYEFYLEKGNHTLSLTASIAPYQSVIALSEQAVNTIRAADQEIRAMTGGQVDKNRTWNIIEEFPELPQTLGLARTQLLQMSDAMQAANHGSDNITQMLQTTAQEINSYLKKPNTIPYHMDELTDIIEQIGGIRETLVKSPLQLDQIYIVPAGKKLPSMEANWGQKAIGMFNNFVYSFTRHRYTSEVEEDTLNVWVNRGRDYVDLLQELANHSFTPETGIKVKVNLLQNENLLVLSNAAGLSPDVALGQPQDKPSDFAMRNALLDLHSFPDFQQVADQFAPGALLPYVYNGGYYALPETQSFKVLFYRKDILQQLGLKVPDTWDDVYDLMPTLLQNSYNFYIPPGDFMTFFYQNGAELFTKDGMKSALDTPEGFKGFKQWTDLFSIYGMEKSVPSFFQHFRKGDMPIGIADYNMYVQMLVAAPELTGWWGIAPIPGTKQADGTIVRWTGGGQTSSFIYKNSKHPQEAWTFLKWLMSADVQELYGSELESFNGTAFRWNTANVEAFSRLPWKKEDLKVILDQWRWMKEAPNLPGSYMVQRELTNAWNRTVIDGMNDRESLEEAITNINREIMRKEQEFGFVDSKGAVQHTLPVPSITAPWEGVNRYVPR